MKSKIFSVLLTMVALGLGGCRSEYDPLSDGNHRQPVEDEVHNFYKVSLSFGGDYISESEEPLRGEGDGTTFVGVNVFRTSKEVGAQEEYYAYGVYKYEANTFNPAETGITIDLYSGYTYTFETTILIEREDKLDLNENSYREPFRDSNEYALRQDDMGFMIYNDKVNLPGLSSGTAKVDIGESRNILNSSSTVIRYPKCGYPQVKRFYGKSITPYDPLTPGNKVSVEVGYKNFELMVKAGTIPEGSSVQLQDVKLETSSGMPDDGMAILFPNGLKFASTENTADKLITSWSGLYSMNDLSENGSDTFTLKFYWNDGSNSPKTFTESVTVKAKIRKILTINITGESSTKSEGSLVFQMDEEDLTDEDQTISKNFSTN